MFNLTFIDNDFSTENFGNTTVLSNVTDYTVTDFTVTDLTYTTQVTEETEFLLNDVTDFCWKVFPPIIIIFGTLGNVLTILVLRRREIGHISSAPYLKTLACVDIVVLWAGLVRHWIRRAFGVDVRSLTNVGCKIHIFTVYSSVDWSVWLLVAVTVERFVCVCFPFRARDIKPVHRVVTIGVIFILFTLLNFHFLIGSHLVGYPPSDPDFWYCHTTHEGYMSFLSYTWSWIDFSAFCFIPFIMIVASNAAIIIKLYLSRRNTRVHPILATSSTATAHASTSASHDQTNNSGNTTRTTIPMVDMKRTSGTRVSFDARVSEREQTTNSTGRRKDKISKNMTVLLLTLNTVFLVTTAPISIYLIYYPYWPDRDLPQQQAYLNFTYMFVNMLSYLNNAVNFLLYCLTGPRFRVALRGVLGLAVPDFATTSVAGQSVVGDRRNTECTEA